MAASLLITGTDTEVGKTFVGAGLAAALIRDGFRVAPFKPVETGCLFDPATHSLIPSDARLLEAATATKSPLDTICPYRFALPAAPWVAAEREGKAIDPAVLERCYRELAHGHDWVIVESAGGILVPMARDFHFADLAKSLNLPVLVVAGSKLGVLNQTLLTLEFLQQNGLTTVGCVLNHPYGDATGSPLGHQHLPALDTNANTLRRLTSVPVWVVPDATRTSQPEMDIIFDRLADDIIARVPRAVA